MSKEIRPKKEKSETKKQREREWKNLRNAKQRILEKEGYVVFSFEDVKQGSISHTHVLHCCESLLHSLQTTTTLPFQLIFEKRNPRSYSNYSQIET